MLPIHFAPMQGYTDSAYRQIHARYAGGIDTYYTPFIRWEKGDVRNKDIAGILSTNNEGLHLVPQIICGTTDDFNRLTDIIAERGYSEIDINMGCPAPMQTKLRRGSGILPHPDIVSALAKEIGRRTDIRYSVKMRLGFEDKNDWRQLLPILNDTPLHHITIHPRIGTQMYKGNVDMESFAEFADACRQPLIYNGDLLTLDQIRQMESHYPTLSGIMIGRGLLARPTLATEYRNGTEMSPSERRQTLLRMHEDMLRFCTDKYKADSQILLHIHAFWEYQEEFLGRKLWKKIMKAGSMRNYLKAVAEV